MSCSEAPGSVRINLTAADTILKVEMVNDVPAHVGEVSVHPVLGRLDNAENILANKLTAVVDRREPKDLADIWGFCCRMGLTCEAALSGAVSDAPDRDRFIADLTEIGERLLLLR